MSKVITAIAGAIMVVVGVVFPGPWSAYLVGMGATMVLGSTAAALQKKPKSGQTLFDAQSRQLSIRQAAAPRRIIYGSIRAGGILTFIHLTGTNGEYLHIIITICKGKISAINNVYFDGVNVPLDGSGNATGTYAGHVHVEKNVGDPADSAQPFTGLATDAPTKWTANHLQRGHAKVYLRLKWNADLFPNGLPNVSFDIDGRLVYDPRTGTTVFRKNVALAINDYLVNTDFGMGAIYADEINETTLTAAANVCDEDVTLKAGGTEDRYTINGMFDTSERPVDVIQQMAIAMGGYLVYVAGKYEFYAGAYRTPSVTLTEVDARGPLKVRTRLSRREIFNGIKGTFISAANNWQPADFPPYLGGFLSEDGNERVWKDVNYPFTTSQATAQRLSKLALLRARRQITVEFPAKLSAYVIQPPDVVQVTNTRFGWSAKTFEVVSSQLTPEEDDEGAPFLGVNLMLRETDSAVYAWTAATDETTAATPGTTTLPKTDTVGAPTNLVLTSSATTALMRSDGVRISRIKATWTAPADQFVISGGKIVGEYKKNADATWLPAFEVAGAMTEAYVTGVDDAVAYDVRILAVNANGARGAYLTVTNHTVTGPALISPNASYRPLTNPLTAADVGATATISIAAFTMRFPGNDVSINSGSIASLSFNTLYYIYYTDSDFNGGAVTYGQSTTKEDTLNGLARFFVGSIRTPVDGGPDTAGNNDGGSGAQSGGAMLLFPAEYQSTTSWTDPSKSFDRDFATYAFKTQTAPGTAETLHHHYYFPGSFPAAYKSVKVKATYEVPTNSLNGTGTSRFYIRRYLKDGGTLTFVETLLATAAPGSTVAKTTFEAALSVSLGFSQMAITVSVAVEASDSSGTITGRLYEIWIEAES